MLILLNIYTKNQILGIFAIKNSHLEHFYAEYTKNSGYLMRFFRKIGKFALFSLKLTIKSNDLGRKLRKIGFFAKVNTNFHKLFLQIIACGYILAQLLKTTVSPHKIKVRKSQNSNTTKYPQVIVEKTENSPNLSSYTIEYKLVRNSHLLSQKLAFSQVSQQLFNKQVQSLTHNHQKAAINCSYIYCEETYGKVLQTCTISLQAHYCGH